METKAVCVGNMCPFIIEVKLDDGMVEYKCRKKPILIVGGFKTLYSGPDDESLIDGSLVLQSCPLPPQKPS